MGGNTEPIWVMFAVTQRVEIQKHNLCDEYCEHRRVVYGQLMPNAWWCCLLYFKLKCLSVCSESHSFLCLCFKWPTCICVFHWIQITLLIVPALIMFAYSYHQMTLIISNLRRFSWDFSTGQVYAHPFIFRYPL